MDYYFHDTGEVRRPQVGEWIWDEVDEFFMKADCLDANYDYPIFARHEVLVPPDKIERIDITGFYGFNECFCMLLKIPISPPKPKVKKWIWECNFEGISWKTEKPYSEKEIEAKYLYAKRDIHKIDETMIETEE